MENSKLLTSELTDLAAQINKIKLYGRSLFISLERQRRWRDKFVYLKHLASWQYYRLFPSTDEFHHSLNLSMYLLASEDLIHDFYVDDIMRQRQKIRENGLKRF